MIIKNGLVWEKTGKFIERDLLIDDDTHTITDIVKSGKDNDSNNKNNVNICSRNNLNDNVIDAAGLYVIPGLVDIHIHGSVGCDFSDGDANGLSEIASYLHSCGITSFCPTSMTLPEEQLLKAFATINDVVDDDKHSHIAGIHMEGPFLSPEKKGAQKAIYLRNPDIAMFKHLQNASDGNVRIITIAPELPDSMNFIKEFHSELTISLGHSCASYDIAKEAFEAGANHVTHLFNAMPPLHHRNPGIIGAASDAESTMVEIICDGIHIHPSVIRNTFRMFGKDRMILISDAMRATGMKDGEYELGGQPVHKKGHVAALKDGTLAGSATNLYDCMKNAVKFGIPLAAAVKAATYNPAKSIGLEKDIGNLAVGARADILLLDRDLNIVKIL